MRTRSRSNELHFRLINSERLFSAREIRERLRFNSDRSSDEYDDSVRVGRFVQFSLDPYSFVCHEFLLRNEKAPKLLWRKRVKMSKQEIVVCCSFFPSQASKQARL
jgi:hypothetical protein